MNSAKNMRPTSAASDNSANNWPYNCAAVSAIATDITYFSRSVNRRLRSQLRSPELVEDACQETFLRVLAYFRAGKVLNNPAALPGFIHSVCHNVALEFLR